MNKDEDPVYVKIEDRDAIEWIKLLLKNSIAYPNSRTSEYMSEMQHLYEALSNPIKEVDLIKQYSKVAPVINKTVVASRKNKKKPALTKEDKNNPLICNDHPTYGGRYTPRKDCSSCWSIYKSFHPMEYVVKRRDFERKLRSI